MIFSARPQDRTDRVGARIDSVLRFFFGQKKVVEKTTCPPSAGLPFVQRDGEQVPLLHLLGLPVITHRLGRDADPGLFPSFSLRAACLATRSLALYAASTVSAAGLVVVVFAVFRRTVLQPRLIPMSRDAAAILGAIGGLMISYFGMRFTEGALVEVSWWAHVVILLAFLNYLLYSKHSHIIAALPNIYFRNLGQRGVLPKLNMEADDIAATGVVQEGKDFTWKSLLDGFACTECARCTNFCPAYNTGKPLSPMQVVHDLRDDLRSRMPDRGPLDAMSSASSTAATPEAADPKPLIGGRTSEEVLWACTTCGACQEVCPVFIDQPEKILRCART
jgi:Pyruvate/2-oxoacid:ferredoxin oxidoreductase delta subunit